MKRSITIISILFCAGFIGCVRVDAKKQAPEAVQMVITRDNSGVNMQFKSEKGMNYSVYYRNPNIPNSKWSLLPIATNLTGTGELILIKDESRDAFYRRYRLHTIVPGAPFTPEQY
ncbi:hypothetical protein P3T73_11695 [Kiritimatiellota bacterium B12222]|nr:hypothetical protein P3T73_11695 [Kiritimatiellota bacterium B12222]